uniref:Dihydrolipoamide acetyltransferase component of pyruvate dehydrogenase complex n=1 Tax=Panagrellus redivivus TaxID=6233 RepID=A0A7E4ZS76_PANRE
MLLRSLFLPSGLQFRGFHYSASLAKLVPFKLADIGEGIAEVEMKEWYVKEGDKVSQFDNICEVQSDKAAVTITSRFDGVVKNLLHDVGSIVKVGSVLVNIDTDDAVDDAPSAESPSQAESTPSTPASTPSTVTHGSTSGKAIATPAVRRIAMENNLKLSQISGTGKDGRVLKEDVLRFLGQIPPASSESTPTKPASSPVAPVTIVKGEDKVVPVRGYTRAMVKSMSESLKIPHFGYDDEIYFDQLVKLRGQLKHIGKEKGVKLSYMPIIIKATSLALSKYPILNSSIDGNFDNLIYKAAHNICLAIDTPGGLVVPNIKHCEQKTIWEIAADLNKLQEAGAKQAIKSEDLAGGTFTLSNIGAIGGTYAIPIIFPPQVAIGAIGKIQKLPRYDAHDNVYPAHVVKFSWAADHRVIDGATIARFSNLLKDYLENPALMATELR